MHKRINLKVFGLITSLLIIGIFGYACKSSHSSKEENSDTQSREDSSNEEPIDIDTLKVVTIYGPTSFFDYRGELMGMDYENAKSFAQEEGMEIEVKAVENIHQLIASLKNGEAHLAAYPVPIIAEYKNDVLYCGHKEITTQVLVQKKTSEKITDVTQLVGKDVYVEKGSKYQFRLENLNEELGGGINIKALENDTVDSVDLMQMVNQGEIDFSVVDSDIASLYRGGYPNLDTSLKLSSEQAGSWAVGKELEALAHRIDKWENRTHSSDFIKEIYRQYYEQTMTDNFDTNLSYFKERNLAKGVPVSDFDSYFKKYAPITGYDWRLLAAIAYCESRYNTNIASRFGAYGLMQVMPATARSFGVSDLSSPDGNVMAAAKFIQKLDNSLKNKVEDPEERLKFVVAAYNSGLGHILDAVAIADKVGLNPQKWTGNVSVAALMKSRPEYYNDPIVKCGYFRGRETVNFVDQVTSIYRYLKTVMPA